LYGSGNSGSPRKRWKIQLGKTETGADRYALIAFARRCTKRLTLRHPMKRRALVMAREIQAVTISQRDTNPASLLCCWRMNAYLLCFLESDGRVRRTENMIAADDPEVIAYISKLSYEHVVELWAGNRLIKRLDPKLN
jgi:hypothetical protein